MLPNGLHDSHFRQSIRPKSSPLTEFAQVLAQARGQPEGWRDWKKQLDELADAEIDRFLRDCAADLRGGAKAPDATILLAIDQAEVLLGVGDEPAKFLQLIAAMIEQHLPYLVVLTLRSDFLGPLQCMPAFEGRFEVFPIATVPREHIRQIIEGPARVVGLRIEEDLIAAAMRDAATDDVLRLLDFAQSREHRYGSRFCRVHCRRRR